ncbi:MAG: hypothetical protein RBT41_02905 [Clostridia bacterium]|jgi:ribosomal protein L7Ae-like RNA K-turn-binding protein|nr:hypothetical protein [Clostridia bacterium]
MMKITNEIGALLGFARKAGKLYAGEAAVKSAVKRNAAGLLILAGDLPVKRKEYWRKYCELTGLAAAELGTKEEWGNILGMSERGILAVADRKMAAAIIARLQEDK